MARQEIRKTLYTCDICGKESEKKEEISELIIRIPGKSDEHYDLCRSCANHCLENGINRVSSNRKFMDVASIGAKLEAVLKILSLTNKDYASRKGWPEWLVSNIRHDKYKFQGKKGTEYRDEIEKDYKKYCTVGDASSICKADIFDDNENDGN